MPVIPGHAASRRILVEERKKRMVLVGDHLHEGVSEQRLVEGQTVEHLPQRLTVSVHPLDERSQQPVRAVVVETLSGDVVGLVVYDPSMRGRAARHERQSHRKEVVIAPTPVFVIPGALRHGRAGKRIGIGRQGKNTCFMIFHWTCFLYIRQRPATYGRPLPVAARQHHPD